MVEQTPKAGNSKPLKVLGVDPGSQVTGVGVIQVQGDQQKHLFSQSIKLSSADLPIRLSEIYQQLQAVIAQTRPDVLAIEKVFIAKNPQSALVLGHARGAAILAAVNNQVPVFEYAATEIKKTVVGRGRADKAQVQHMVRVLLGLDFTPQIDAADALACAICHSQQSRLEERMQDQGVSELQKKNKALIAQMRKR
jgi:crossover junction endodeoxyribonuclease RuvC